jgi:alpha-L-rhamnosidase
MSISRAMKHSAVAILVAMYAASTLQAQPAGHWGTPLEPSLAPNWQAQWIWLPESSDADMLLARKTFTLPEVPDKAVLSITASSRYQLFINGRYHCSGPARSAAHHQSFDVLDVTNALRRGKNVLAVRVHFQREDVSYYGLSRAGLLAQLDHNLGSQASTLPTDASWRVSPEESWLNASPKMARFHLEVCDRVDLRRRISGWQDTDFDDRQWSRARVLQREEGWPLPQPNDRPTHLIPPWTTLVARDIPYLTESVTTARRLAHEGSVPATSGGADLLGDGWAEAPVIPRVSVPENGVSANRREMPITVAANKPGKCRVLVYDLGEVQNGRPFLDIAAPAGTVVDIMSAPYLLDDSVKSPIVVSDYVDRIVLSGKRERWEAFYLKPARWLAVVFRHLTAEATLHAAGVVRTEYPFVQKGSFETQDLPELQTLWDAAAKTIEVCTTDAYTDNYRERRQYAQTAYYACLGNYPVFGDSALQRRYLRQIAEEQLPNGIMPAYAPRHGDDFMVILDSNCFWIRGLHQYLLWSGDCETTRELLPAAWKLLELLHSYTNQDGLIDSPPYPYWLDHALNDRRGANFCFNGHYLGALEDFAQVLDWLDEPAAADYRKRAARVRQALREKLWDPVRQLFADALIDGELSDQFSEHANAMAMALRIASLEQMEAVAAQLGKNEPHDFIRRESGVVMVTPAMSYYLHAGLCEAGRTDQSLDLLQARFAHMLGPQHNGTLWEEWWLDGSGRNGRFAPRPSGRSDAQTESAFFPGLFTRYILGIEPTEPGLREVVLRYYDSDRLLRRRGAIPTPSGLLEVNWDISPAEFNISLHTPPAMTVRIDLSSLGWPPQDDISIDGATPPLDQLKDGHLVVPPGDHTIGTRRQQKKS